MHNKRKSTVLFSGLLRVIEKQRCISVISGLTSPQFAYWLEHTHNYNMINSSTHAHLPVLDFKPLMQPPAEKHWLWRNFLYVHTLEVYVDSGTFFAQEFCQTQKNKETKQKQEEPFSKTARRVSTLDQHKVTLIE